MSVRKYRVLHIITHLELGGVQKVSLSLIKGLNYQLFEVHFITSPFGRLVRGLETITGLKVKLIPSLKREIDPIRDILTLIKLFNYIRVNRFDIVHTHSPKAGILGRWAAKLAGVPVIIHTIHGFPFYDRQNFIIRRFYILIEYLTAHITDRLIAVCESDIEKGLSAGIGKRDKYILIREGIEINETEMPVNKITKRQLGMTETCLLVGMVACLKSQKSPLDFVRMAALVRKRVPQANFILVGDGPLRREVENLVAKLNLENNFFILGWRDDALDIISLTDMMVLTSRWEGLPLALLEAMYLDKPIVATNVDGIKELIKDGENGFLVEAGDYQNLAKKIVELIENEGLRNLFISRNHSQVLPQFSLSLMVKQTEELYLNLIPRQKSPALKPGMNAKLPREGTPERQQHYAQYCTKEKRSPGL